jgi:hypothetical protein
VGDTSWETRSDCIRLRHGAEDPGAGSFSRVESLMVLSVVFALRSARRIKYKYYKLRNRKPLRRKKENQKNSFKNQVKGKRMKMR